MRGSALLLLILVSACSSANALPDGGTFTPPDSGYVFDSGPAVIRDAEPGDSGPFQCMSSCANNFVCGCLDTRPPTCGCNAPQSFGASCDPQVQESCQPRYTCRISRKFEGQRYVCTDGREGAPCSHVDESCNTAIGCVCKTSLFGTQCKCEGEPGPNPAGCDPLVPASCPGGTCVRVMTPSSAIYICSDGSQYQPCVLGDNSCRTSLGCTCALAGSRDICRCTEPATQAGEPCDPRVPASCAPPLECQVRFDPENQVHVSECAPSSGVSPDGGSNPFDCDPQQPACPPDFTCTEVNPGRYRCIPDR